MFRLKLVDLGVVRRGSDTLKSRPMGAYVEKSILVAPGAGGTKGNGLVLLPDPKAPIGTEFTVVKGVARAGALIELAPFVPSAKGGCRSVCSANSSSERL